MVSSVPRCSRTTDRAHGRHRRHSRQQRRNPTIREAALEARPFKRNGQRKRARLDIPAVSETDAARRLHGLHNPMNLGCVCPECLTAEHGIHVKTLGCEYTEFMSAATHRGPRKEEIKSAATVHGSGVADVPHLHTLVQHGIHLNG